MAWLLSLRMIWMVMMLGDGMAVVIEEDMDGDAAG